MNPFSRRNIGVGNGISPGAIETCDCEVLWPGPAIFSLLRDLYLRFIGLFLFSVVIHSGSPSLCLAKHSFSHPSEMPSCLGKLALGRVLRNKASFEVNG